MNRLAIGVVAAVAALAYQSLREKRHCLAALQRYFYDFHDSIRLSNVDENKALRIKRDVLLEDLSAHLPPDAPAWRSFNQGSYAMNTGINPRDGNYDIDVGIVFDCFSSRYADPVQLKRLVHDALVRPGRNVRIRRACVTVEYIKNGKIDYHVDLAIYVNSNKAGTLKLAMGRLHSKGNFSHWSEQDPKGLIDTIRSKYSNKDGEQFRRLVRYLKRWRNERFSGGGAPVSIALTCLANAHFLPKMDPNNAGDYSDALALEALIEKILEGFSLSWQEGKFCMRVVAHLPVTPGSDLLATLTNAQMRNFREKLERLRHALLDAMTGPNIASSCEVLRGEFGERFPVVLGAEI